MGEAVLARAPVELLPHTKTCPVDFATVGGIASRYLRLLFIASACLLWSQQVVAVATARINARTRSINHTLVFETDTFGREEISAADVRMFKLHGFNHLRVGLDLRLLMPRYASSEEIEARHQTLASDLDIWLGEGLGITLTAFINNLDDFEFLSTASGRAEFEAFWADLAARYGHLSSELLSFEILNEPTAVTGSTASDCGFSACSPPVWRDYQAKFIDAIRSNAPNHTILVSAADFNNFPALIQFEPYDDGNLIYVVHYYPAQVFVAQSAWGQEYGLRYPPCLAGTQAVADSIEFAEDAQEAQNYLDEKWRQERMREDLQQVADWASANGVQVFANEIAAYSQDVESRTRWIRDVRMVLESFNIPWAVWSTSDYYTNGWVKDNRFPRVELLRGTNGLPWVGPDAACTGEPASRVDLAVSLEPLSTHMIAKVSNNGQDTANDVVARIGFPLNTVILSAVSDEGSCNSSTSVVVCQLGALLPGMVRTLTIVTNASSHDTLPTQAIVVSDGTDKNESNNFAVRALPDSDGDGIGDDIDADDDNDGLSDMYEFSRSLAQTDAGDQLLDPDGDGYSNLTESQGYTDLFGTNPFDALSKPEPPGESLAANLSTVIATPKDDFISFSAIAALTNKSSGTVTNCSVAPQGAYPIYYRFYPVDPVTEEIDGPAYQRRTLADGETGRFWIEMVASKEFQPEGVFLHFDCDNTAPTVITDGFETILFDTDADNIPDVTDPDDDNDGLPDSFEVTYGFDPLDAADASLDGDGDGLSNLQEFQFGANPNNPDTDNDGVNDGDEVDAGTDPRGNVAAVIQIINSILLSDD